VIDRAQIIFGRIGSVINGATTPTFWSMKCLIISLTRVYLDILINYVCGWGRQSTYDSGAQTGIIIICISGSFISLLYLVWELNNIIYINKHGVCPHNTKIQVHKSLPLQTVSQKNWKQLFLLVSLTDSSNNGQYSLIFKMNKNCMSHIDAEGTSIWVLHSQIKQHM
jgi:hypothetical protein